MLFWCLAGWLLCELLEVGGLVVVVLAFFFLVVVEETIIILLLRLRQIDVFSGVVLLHVAQFVVLLDYLRTVFVFESTVAVGFININSTPKVCIDIIPIRNDTRIDVRWIVGRLVACL